MTQPEQAPEPSLGDLVITDLEQQLSEPDPRYARKCKELAIVRSQYAQLAKFVNDHKEALGLTDQPETSEEAIPDVEVKPVAPEKDPEPQPAVNGARLAHPPTAKTGK